MIRPPENVPRHADGAAGPSVDDDTLSDLLAAWMGAQRWYGGATMPPARPLPVHRAVLHSSPDLRVELVLVRVEPPDGGDRDGEGANDDGGDEPGDGGQSYQVPLAYRPTVEDRPAAHVVGSAGGSDVIDALRDPSALDVLARLLEQGAERDGVRFRLSPGARVPVGGHARPLEVDQSNSSVVFDDRMLLKSFRRVRAGLNPDVELHLALADVDCPAVAPIRGWVEVDGEGGEPATLAMAQEFVAGAADGWSMATTSVRDLFVEADLLAAEVGTDFADESLRLGAAVAQVHADLATALGTGTSDGATVAREMRGRLDEALLAVADLGPFADAARAVLDRVADLGEVEVQRVHGDLHLGQVLRAPDRWIVLDFEGEPAAPLANRRRLDSPVRDVAGMLRSVDYAAQHTLVGSGDRQRRFRAREWADRNSGAFCAGYAGVADVDPRDLGVLLTAYLLDKALYEVVYENRHRPSWLQIPLTAVAQLVG